MKCLRKLAMNDKVTVTINESTEVELSGALIIVYFHKERIGVHHMVKEQIEYSIGDILEIGLADEIKYRKQQNDIAGN